MWEIVPERKVDHMGMAYEIVEAGRGAGHWREASWAAPWQAEFLGSARQLNSFTVACGHGERAIASRRRFRSSARPAQGSLYADPPV